MKGGKEPGGVDAAVGVDESKDEKEEKDEGKDKNTNPSVSFRWGPPF